MSGFSMATRDEVSGFSSTARVTCVYVSRATRVTRLMGVYMGVSRLMELTGLMWATGVIGATRVTRSVGASTKMCCSV